ncbi:MAG: DNA/RNA non-specific endonuclease [Chloroflexi bacterium]|nr:DNA/RNA non-specific endonuclease [Chloroflexota bacterium]
MSEELSSRAISISKDYSDRRGYDSNFLDVTVPLPQLSVSSQQNSDLKTVVLAYHHFSLLMNRQRKLAYYTAVNIDGRTLRRLKRESDKWTFDPRIDKADQMGPEIYVDNTLDLGHLVRRIDPAWGESELIAKTANDDTFHFTNCSPQHKNLNENKKTWAGLEDYILNNALANQLKVSVFSGPVFEANDFVYRDVQIPKRYWKVVAMIKTDGQLSATAYLLDQSQLLADLGARGFTFGEYRMFQVSVATIETLTNLDFGELNQHDPLAGRRSLDMFEITSLDMIQV